MTPSGANVSRMSSATLSPAAAARAMSCARESAGGATSHSVPGVGGQVADLALSSRIVSVIEEEMAARLIQSQRALVAELRVMLQQSQQEQQHNLLSALPWAHAALWAAAHAPPLPSTGSAWRHLL